MPRFPWRKTIALAGLLCLLSNPAALAQKADGNFAGSLLFTEDEFKAINAALALRPLDGGQMPDGRNAPVLEIPENKPVWLIERLHLSALIYIDPQNWTLWFGDRQVRRDTVPPFLSNLLVTANYVDLGIVPTPGAEPIAVRLRPNQTFLIGTLRITEGSPRSN